MNKELIKGLIQLIKRFLFGTPADEINYDFVKYNYYKNNYYKTLRENKLLKLIK